MWVYAPHLKVPNPKESTKYKTLKELSSRGEFYQQLFNSVPRDQHTWNVNF